MPEFMADLRSRDAGDAKLLGLSKQRQSPRSGRANRALHEQGRPAVDEVDPVLIT
jgi:hypothetical protein